MSCTKKHLQKPWLHQSCVRMQVKGHMNLRKARSVTYENSIYTRVLAVEA